MPLNVQPGDRFPDLRLRDHAGQEISIAETVNDRPTILTFYRGHW